MIHLVTPRVNRHPSAFVSSPCQQLVHQRYLEHVGSFIKPRNNYNQLEPPPNVTFPMLAPTKVIMGILFSRRGRESASQQLSLQAPFPQATSHLSTAQTYLDFSASTRACTMLLSRRYRWNGSCHQKPPGPVPMVPRS